MDTQKINLNYLLEEFDSIIIPDIQRDYVMGSGGVDKVGNDKLKDLLKAIEENDNSFYFSCIMGHSKDIENKKSFYIYDGQQRIVTLIYLAAYLSNVEKNSKYNEKIAKFSFLDRNSANEHLNEILFKSIPKTNISIEDFTTFSIDNLYKEFFDKNGNSKYKKIDLDFIMNNIEFDLINVDEASDAEQFFMDLNDGLMLEEYEIYKAELNNKIYKLFNGDENFKKWALKIDNEWLEFFLDYKTNTCCEEEAEINFIKFCFRMIYIERFGNEKDYKKRGLEWIKKEDVHRIYTMVNNLIKMDLKIETDKTYTPDEEYINFAWEPCRDSYGKPDRMFIDEKNPGVYWNLKNTNYTGMLNLFLSNIYNFDKIKDDLIIWFYLSNLNLNKNKLYNYLRFIKKILNSNRLVNSKAYYDQSIYYCRYGVYGIQEYYGNFFKVESMKEHVQYLRNVITINKYFILDKYDELGKFINDIKNNYSEENIVNVLNQEYLKYTSMEYAEIEKVENMPVFNGIIENVLDDSGKLILEYDLLESFLKRKSLIDLYSDLSNIINDFDEYIIKNLSICWKYTTGAITCEKGGIPIQCLIDFYTHNDSRWKTSIQKLLRGKFENNYTVDVSDSKKYLKYYKYLPKGWFYEDIYEKYQIRRVKSAQKENYYIGWYDWQFENITSITKWFNLSLYKIVSNGQGELSVTLDDQLVNGIPYIRSNLHSGLKDLFCNKGYKEIYYYSDRNINNCFLQSHVEINTNGLLDIKDYIEKYTWAVIFIEGRYYLFTKDCL